MAKHTVSEYGELLKAALEKCGMRVGLRMSAGELGWEGTLVLARGTVRGEGSEEYVTELHSDAYVYVDDEGAIRVYYSEPIIVDMEKKRRYDEEQRELIRREEDRRLHPEEYFGFDEDDDENAYFSDEDGEYSVEDSQAEAYEEALPSEKCEEQSENPAYMSEKQELALLRALNELGTGIMLYSPKNETRLVYNGKYRMEACSRVSAKKAAVYICDELFVLCGYIEYLSKQLNFVRVKPVQPWSGWEDENILDNFSQIDEFIALRVKQRIEEERALRYPNGYTSQYEWMQAYQDGWKDGWKEEWGDPQQIVDSIKQRMDEGDPDLTLSEIIKCGAACVYLKQKIERELAQLQAEEQE